MSFSSAVMAVSGRDSDHMFQMFEVLPGVSRVILDTKGDGALPTAYQAWSAFHPEATHHLVLHDDLLLPSNLISLVGAVMESNPENILSFHAFSVKVKRYFDKGHRWAVCKQVLGQANLYPIPILKRLMKFCETSFKLDVPLRPQSKQKLGDANAVSMFLRVEGLKAYMPLPNFVQHVAPRESIWGQRNEAKVSPCYIGDYVDPEFNWFFDEDATYPTVYPYMRRDRWEWKYYAGPSPFEDADA